MKELSKKQKLALEYGQTIRMIKGGCGLLNRVQYHILHKDICQIQFWQRQLELEAKKQYERKVKDI